MKHLLIAIIICCVGTMAIGQNKKNQYLSLAIFNTQSARPFEKFAGLFGETFHPGIDAGYGKDFSIHAHHEWFRELKLAYFYHRFVQHGIPCYLNLGYRYKPLHNFSAETSIGAGYMHSIPATAQLKLNGEGEYIKAKGIGRAQATVSFAVGLRYTPNPFASRPFAFFASYQQRLQMPFVKSYVPLLPYNSFSLGIATSINKK